MKQIFLPLTFQSLRSTFHHNFSPSLTAWWRALSIEIGITGDGNLSLFWEPSGVTRMTQDIAGGLAGLSGSGREFCGGTGLGIPILQGLATIQARTTRDLYRIPT